MNWFNNSNKTLLSYWEKVFCFNLKSHIHFIICVQNLFGKIKNAKEYYNGLAFKDQGGKEFDDDGNNTCDYLITNTENGNVIAHYRLEADGGKVGKYIGLLEQGHSSAGKNFGEFLAKKIENLF